jgi:beta-lactamase superfamily II metal-dependent hydrolase
MFKIPLAVIVSFVLLLSCKDKNSIQKVEKGNLLTEWQEGFLDIHHINTGRGDASFLILPDGTTMVFDAGNLDKEKFEKKYKPLKATQPLPNSSISAADFIASYIKNLIPNNKNPLINYGVISHFHQDHYGSLVDLGNTIPIEKMIDRNYPDYNYPIDLKKYLSKDSNFLNYQKFIKENKVAVESLKAGSNSQIQLQYFKDKYPTFQIQNVKANATIWTGNSNETFDYFKAEEMTTFYKGKYNENTLSLALKISYGNFDYFTGGDNTGLQGFGLSFWFDVEREMGKAVCKVEVTTLNHHGNRDATNAFFVEKLNPKVVIQQSWCSDHPGQEVYQNLIYKDKNAEDRAIFATNMHDETLVTYGPWFKDNYKSMHGHVLVRVYPKGDKYEVFILNDDTLDLTVKEKFGPYKSK